MNKNNKNGNVWTILIVVILVMSTIWFFLPKDYFSKQKTSSFGSFNNDRKRATGDPVQLQWKKSFIYTKEDKKAGQSYMKHMIDKKKKEKK